MSDTQGNVLRAVDKPSQSKSNQVSTTTFLHHYLIRHLKVSHVKEYEEVSKPAGPQAESGTHSVSTHPPVGTDTWSSVSTRLLSQLTLGEVRGLHGSITPTSEMNLTKRRQRSWGEHANSTQKGCPTGAEGGTSSRHYSPVHQLTVEGRHSSKCLPS